MINLKKMNNLEFNDYMAISIEDYAKESAKASGVSLKESIEKAKEQFLELMPDGLETKDQYLSILEDSNSKKKVGILWFGKKEREDGPQGFIYDIRLNSEFQGKGLGKVSMLSFEKKAAQMKFTSIGLHVFFHNKRAVNLYERLDYKADCKAESSMTMIKYLNS